MTYLFWKQFNSPPKTLKQLVLFVGHFSNHISKAFYDFFFSIHPGKKKKTFLTFPREKKEDKGYLLKPRYLSASLS